MTGGQDSKGNGGEGEQWQLDAEGARLYSMDDLSDCWNLRDLEMDRRALTDCLNALEQAAARVPVLEKELERIKAEAQAHLLACPMLNCAALNPTAAGSEPARGGATT